MAPPVPAAGGFDGGCGPECCDQPACAYSPQMIGDLLPTVIQILTPTPTLASRVSLTAPPGVRVNGNIIPRPATGVALFDDRAVFFTRPNAPAAVLLLPPSTRVLPLANGSLAVVRVAQVPTERGPNEVAFNESPRPTDRVFSTFNVFTKSFANDIDVYRETIGFETTFLDGCASLEVRLPAVQLDGDNQRIDDIGDVSVGLKYALWECREKGDVWSVGVLATAPTGPSYQAFNGNQSHGGTLQPWTGWVLNSGYVYVQGFSSVSLPLQHGDVTVLYNDIGIGYYAYMGYSGYILSFVTPTVEAHIATPLDHRDRAQAVYSQDEAAVVAGVHFGIGDHAVLTLGAGVPVMGPRPFDVEGVAQFNVRW
jgi:hypothetical protein